MKWLFQMTSKPAVHNFDVSGWGAYGWAWKGDVLNQAGSGVYGSDVRWNFEAIGYCKVFSS